MKVDVSKDFLSNMADENDRNRVELLCESSFVPGVDQSWYILIGNHLQLKQMSAEKLSIRVTYEDTVSAYDETVVIDLKQYFGALIYESPIEDLYQETKKCSNALDSMDRSIQQYIRVIEENNNGV